MLLGYVWAAWPMTGSVLPLHSYVWAKACMLWTETSDFISKSPLLLTKASHGTFVSSQAFFLMWLSEVAQHTKACRISPFGLHCRYNRSTSPDIRLYTVSSR